jgi:hypothetical protein
MALLEGVGAGAAVAGAAGAAVVVVVVGVGLVWLGGAACSPADAHATTVTRAIPAERRIMAA